MTDAFADERSRSLFDAIAKVPKDAVVAGWPLGPIRKMEYLTRRNAFLAGDTHQVLHFYFMVNMRKRMDALFDAYLSVNSMPLYRLRDEFKVTHLIVDTRNFTDPDHELTYYAPWQERIGPRLAEIRGKEFVLNRKLHNAAAIFEQKGLMLLDLSKLP